MRIHENFRRTSAFLASRVPDADGQRLKPVGTAFFVSAPLTEGHDVPAMIIAVTARHVIDGSRPNGNLFLVGNKKAGGIAEINMPHDSWTMSHDTDIAMAGIPKQPDDAEIDMQAVPLSMFADDEFVDQNDVGEGDRVFIAGLFQSVAGRNRVRPIVRFGTISLMPYEPIPALMVI